MTHIYIKPSSNQCPYLTRSVRRTGGYVQTGLSECGNSANLVCREEIYRELDGHGPGPTITQSLAPSLILTIFSCCRPTKSASVNHSSRMSIEKIRIKPE